MRDAQRYDESDNPLLRLLAALSQALMTAL
ncbi:hypothetical protein MCEMSEM22_00971 [Comamonadaceae bacterium]